jgi:hypothetical protein
MFGDKLENMFAEQDGKKPLLFMGTSFTGENGIVFDEDIRPQFDVVFDKIKELYSDDYFFVSKGHPAWPTYEGYESGVNWKSTAGVTQADFNRRVLYLHNNFDFIIPEQIPAEMIALFYGDEYSLCYGGYDSSAYTTLASFGSVTVVFLVFNDTLTQAYTDSVNNNGTTPAAPDIMRPNNFDTFVPNPLFIPNGTGA